jgi:hypothetical protein
MELWLGHQGGHLLDRRAEVNIGTERHSHGPMPQQSWGELEHTKTGNISGFSNQFDSVSCIGQEPPSLFLDRKLRHKTQKVHYKVPPV